MTKRLVWLIVPLLLATTAVVEGQCNPGGGTGGTGPDVIVGEIYGFPNPDSYGNAGGYYAYSCGTTSCNIGTAELLWIAGNNQHPVIAQNMYRLRDGVMEQIGLSWLKHGFTALQQNACGCSCSSSGTGSLLGVGCSDPYSPGLNGNQGSLGPRSEVNNPAAGGFAYPPTLDPFNQDVTWRRLRVHGSDLDPALNAGATYFVEAQYVTPDDATSGNAHNNTSYRQVNVGAAASNRPLSYVGATVRQRAVIEAWPTLVPGVVLQDVFTGETFPGRLIVGYNVTDNGNGTWDYEYAIYNQNSSRGVNGFSVPVPGNVAVTNVGFHDVEYHSNETIQGTDWPGVVSGNSVSWNTDGEANANANAIRWGSMYNFRFTADGPPTPVTATIDLWRNSVFPAPNDRTITVLGPDGDFTIAPTNLSCNTAANFDVDLSWSNGEAYTAIEILRDSVVIATLGGGATSFTDSSVPVGSYEYGVVGIAASGPSAATECNVDVSLDPIFGLACSTSAQDVLLSWTNGDNYTAIQVERDGATIATLGGTATSYTDPAQSEGLYDYTVTGLSGLNTSSGVDCTVDVPPPPPLAFTVQAGNITTEYDELTGVGSFTTVVTGVEGAGNMNYPNDTAGFSIALASDATVLVPTAVTVGTPVAALNSGSGPSFFSESVEADGVTAGVVYDFFATQFLAMDTALELIVVSYDINAANLAGNSQGTFTSLDFVDFQLGVNPVQNVIVVGTASISPAFSSGIVTLNPSLVGEFVRGDCNDDGQVNIADPVFLLDALFPSGTPPMISCENACDGNDDDTLNLADAVRLLDALFRPATPLPAPATCDVDPTSGVLTCDMSSCP